MEQLKPTTDDLERYAQIKFTAPHSLAECFYRLRATGYQEAGFDNGIDASIEKIDDTSYKFCIRRLRYCYNRRYRYSHDSRDRTPYSLVEGRGYLRAMDNGKAIVVGKIYFLYSVPLFLLIFAILFIFTLVIATAPTNDSILLLVAIFVVLIGLFVAMHYFDRRTLIKLLHTALDGDV